MNNFILDVDSYKSSHYLQYPQGTEAMFSYIEARGGVSPETVFFGLQMILSKMAGKKVSWRDAQEADEFFTAHGEPFPLSGWRYIAEEYDGNLPVIIKAVPEGSVIPLHNVLMTIESNDPLVFWLPGWLETQLMRVWYPIAVATQSRNIKKVIYNYLENTSDDPAAEIGFKLHDFGARGVSSLESAEIGGAAHLVNFLGSDTVAGVWAANHYYDEKMAGFSIPAAEHSTITSWGKDHEVDAYRNMITKFAKPGGLVAVVSDSYDIYNAVDKIWGGELHDEVVKSGATIVIRPDSGKPAEVVCKVLELLQARFGVTANSKGYKVLNNVRVIQGDGINGTSIEEILSAACTLGFSATNVGFGMGGVLLQGVNRDTHEMAMKCSAIKVNGVWRDVSKAPVGSSMKKSKAGRLDLVRAGDSYMTVNHPSDGSVLQTVFENGGLVNRQKFADIRKRAWKK